MVGLVEEEELEGRHGGQAVVNIIEGALVDVELTLPAGAAAVEGQAVEVDPGAVFVLQFEPDIVPLVGGQVGVLVHDVLELIHLTAVGQEDEALLGVGQGIFGGVLAEEEMMPGGGEELHGHGVDLGALHAGALQVLGDGFIPGGQIALEGMAGLVGQDVHIAGGVVPVGEDAVGLAGPAEDIKQLVVLHEVDELGRLAAELVVHGPGGVHPHLVALDGDGVAVGESHVQIGEGGLFDAGAPGPAGHHFSQQGNNIPGHLVPEDADFLGAVADAVHPGIGQLTVILVAQDDGLLVQVLDGALVELIELTAMGVEVAGLGLESRPADSGVQALLVGAQLGDGELLAVHFHQGAAVQTLVEAGNGVGLLLEGGDPAVHRQDGIAHPGWRGRSR